MTGFKSDSVARDVWGSVYDAIPKSAFALVAFHLANLCADEPDSVMGVFKRFQEEAETLAMNGILSDAHAKTVRAAIAKA